MSSILKTCRAKWKEDPSIGNNSEIMNVVFFPHSVAMKAMNKVASHINEMQKLHEEYGAVFDQLINEQTADKKEVNKMPFLFEVIFYESNKLSSDSDKYLQSALLILLISGG